MLKNDPLVMLLLLLDVPSKFDFFVGLGLVSDPMSGFEPENLFERSLEPNQIGHCIAPVV
jgi:hypothetical protein